ncbi:MAG: DUF4197 domain-containing protein [Bacteroidetes bacterium]|nr:DUF4197 domain-containing protein [Bacteroidota bacterium]MBM3424420.1 DUF4197 domain-containing protein [Bacteroidota bacterium]
MNKAIVLTALIFSFVACGVIELSSLPIVSTPSAKPQLTNDEVIKGLKEALSIGIKNSVDSTSITDGFLKNIAIRLPFPPDAMKVREKAISLGMQGQVDKFETTLNRAAEEAVKEALPIFKQAILNMSIQDGFAILKGGDGSATKFLKDKTTDSLVVAFLPKVKNATSKVQLTSYWNPIITKYNAVTQFTGGEKINPDLDTYVTRLAIKGLFVIVEKEENKIRKNPGARVTDLLQRVFGSL